MDAYKEVFGISLTPLAVAIGAILFTIVYCVLKNRNLPPGPTGLPYLGYWPFLGEQTAHLQLHEMLKKYGDLFSFQITGQLYINVGSIKSLREAHLSASEAFTDRIESFTMLTFIFKGGLPFINGEAWKVMRKFFSQSLKELGMTAIKENMAGPIYDHLSATVDYLRAKQGQPINVVELFNSKCMSIIRRMLLNDDAMSTEEFNELTLRYGSILEGLSSKDMLIAGEFVRYILFPLSRGYSEAVANQKRMKELLFGVIERREATFDPQNIRDLIDRFIQERNDRKRKNDPTTDYFTNRCLMATLLQLLGDGVLGVASFISSFLTYAAQYPDEQEKVYKELAEVIGPNRQPIMEDKSKLPYTNAFIYEVLRVSDFFPLFPSTQCTRETTLRGYRIPKGTVTVMNVYSAHRDPECFEDPHEFKPSRYIATPEKKRAELPITFGVGKRACAGEAFTMTQVFLFLTTIIKNFKISSTQDASKSVMKMEICVRERT